MTLLLQHPPSTLPQIACCSARCVALAAGAICGPTRCLRVPFLLASFLPLPQGFIQFRLSGEHVNLDVDKLNEQMQIQGAQRIRWEAGWQLLDWVAWWVLGCVADADPGGTAHQVGVTCSLTRLLACSSTNLTTW